MHVLRTEIEQIIFFCERLENESNFSKSNQALSAENDRGVKKSRGNIYHPIRSEQ